MKTTALVFSLLAGVGSSAFAHDYGHADARPRYHGMHDLHERMDRCDYSRPWVHERHHRHHRRAGGAGPCHDIHPGEQLPRYYWSTRYEVHDWRYHDLPRPWQGHRWVRTGHDFVMVDLRTGMISRVILMRHRR